MCDTMCALAEGRALFGKNSDRPVGEVQVFEAHARRPPGGDLQTQYKTIPDAGACAVMGSRPTWLWGFEHGINEHRVAIGNEKVFTAEDPDAAPDALIGMDLVRLGLETGRSAEHAVDVMIDLLERYGQGGLCDQIFGDRYFSSFLVADPKEVIVLETMGSKWVARHAGRPGNGLAISNRLSTRNDFYRACSSVGPDDDIDTWRDPASPPGHANRRLAATRAAVDPEPGQSSTLPSGAPSPTPGDIAAVLRHHGEGPWGSPELDGAPGVGGALPGPEISADGEGVTVCMHVRDYSVTAASMIASLPEDPTEPSAAWVALSAPCVSVFVPVRPGSGIVPKCLSDVEQWQRFDRLRQRAESDSAALPAIRAVLDPLERDLWRANRTGPSAETGASPCEQINLALLQLGV